MFYILENPHNIGGFIYGQHHVYLKIEVKPLCKLTN